MKLLFIFLFSFQNTTDYQLDNLADIICQELQMTGISIVVTDFPPGIEKYDLDGLAFSYSKNIYTIYIKQNIGKELAKKTFIHEMLHVYQMYKGDLQYISFSEVIWKGDTYKYEKGIDFPWEIDCRKSVKKLQRILKL